MHAGRKASHQALKTIEPVTDIVIGGEKAIQFSHGKKNYAAGHADMTYADSNHARGVRHIRFYDAGKVVLDIEGDFADQQFGSNFQFKNVAIYLPGEWEADFIKLTEVLRLFAAKRKNAFRKKRAAENARLYG